MSHTLSAQGIVIHSLRGGAQGPPGAGAVLGSYTWATLPAAATAGARALAWVTDLGENGTLMQSTGARWRAVNGAAALKTLGATVSGIGTTETIVMQTQIPAGALQVNDTLRIFMTIAKSGTTDSNTLFIRMGTTGTTSDTIITGVSALAASGQAGGGIFDLRLESNTALRKVGTNQGNTHSYSTLTGTSALAAAATIADASANALWLSIGITTSGATNTSSATSGSINLITP